jgi:GT2 family glycosyltransferase
LYLNAKGHCLIGFDDDAHPLHIDFVKRTIAVFEQNPKAGIVAFEEIKGVFNSDEDALKSVDAGLVEYVTNDFIGSGFAISKEAYNATNGFPLWMDIYGEESCVALEVLSKGYDILYTNKIKVNHRVDIEKRKLCKQNYYRFGKQLKNSTYYFLVYYPFPLYPILKLYWHNLRKYALTDWECCKIYFKTLLTILINFPCILKYRNPVEKSLILKMRKLTELKF